MGGFSGGGGISANRKGVKRCQLDIHGGPMQVCWHEIYFHSTSVGRCGLTG